MREVLPTHHGGCNSPGAKPRARKGVKMVDRFHIKAIFNEKRRATRTRFGKALNGVADKPSQGTAGE